MAAAALGCGPAIIVDGGGETGATSSDPGGRPAPTTGGRPGSTTGSMPNPVTSVGSTEPMTSAEVGVTTDPTDPTGVDTGPECFNPPFGGEYQECNGSFCPGGGECLTDEFESYEVCTRGCFDVCDCWPWEGGGPAELRCRDDFGEFSGRCVLDCSESLECPSGMFCVPDILVCAFPPSDPPGASSSGSGGSSGTSTNGSSG